MTCGDLRLWSRGCLPLAATCLLAACVNIDPSWEDTDDGGSAGAGSEVPVACQMCLTTPNDPGPGCADEQTACAASETCLALSECVITSGCHPAVDLQAFYACAWPCAEQYGVTLYDETYEIAMPVAFCIMDHCEEPCSMPTE